MLVSYIKTTMCCFRESCCFGVFEWGKRKRPRLCSNNQAAKPGLFAFCCTMVIDYSFSASQDFFFVSYFHIFIFPFYTSYGREAKSGGKSFHPINFISFSRSLTPSLSSLFTFFFWYYSCFPIYFRVCLFLFFFDS